jgi:hypothetical protein
MVNNKAYDTHVFVWIMEQFYSGMKCHGETPLSHLVAGTCHKYIWIIHLCSGVDGDNPM